MAKNKKAARKINYGSLRKVSDNISQLWLRGDFTQAAQLLRQAIGTLPSSKARASLSLSLAVLEVLQKNFREANRLCSAAGRDDPGSHGTNVTIGTLLAARKGSQRQALKRAKEALRLAKTTSQQVQAHALQAKCFLRLGMYTAAEKSLKDYRTAWTRARGNNPDIVIPQLELLEESLAAGLAFEDCQHLCEIAILRARRQNVLSLYKGDLVRLIARAKERVKD